MTGRPNDTDKFHRHDTARPCCSHHSDQRGAAPISGALAYTINFLAPSGTLTLAADLPLINLVSGASLTIQGNNDTLNGAGLYQGLSVYAGTVVVNNLTITDALAKGGTGGNGDFAGGGGAGLGGGLFVAAAANVTINNVTFSDDSATGGTGGSSVGAIGPNNSKTGNGGGGGLGGNASNGSLGGGGGGGGIGNTATGGAGTDGYTTFANGDSGYSGSAGSASGAAAAGDGGKRTTKNYAVFSVRNNPDYHPGRASLL